MERHEWFEMNHLVGQSSETYILGRKRLVGICVRRGGPGMVNTQATTYGSDVRVFLFLGVVNHITDEFPSFRTFLPLAMTSWKSDSSVVAVMTTILEKTSSQFIPKLWSVRTWTCAEISRLVLVCHHLSSLSLLVSFKPLPLLPRDDRTP
jgi:hypothetical protein